MCAVTACEVLALALSLGHELIQDPYLARQDGFAHDAALHLNDVQPGRLVVPPNGSILVVVTPAQVR